MPWNLSFDSYWRYGVYQTSWARRYCQRHLFVERLCEFFDRSSFCSDFIIFDQSRLALWSNELKCKLLSEVQEDRVFIFNQAMKSGYVLQRSYVFVRGSSNLVHLSRSTFSCRTACTLRGWWSSKRLCDPCSMAKYGMWMDCCLMKVVGAMYGVR